MHIATDSFSPDHNVGDLACDNFRNISNKDIDRTSTEYWCIWSNVWKVGIGLNNDFVPVLRLIEASSCDREESNDNFRTSSKSSVIIKHHIRQRFSITFSCQKPVCFLYSLALWKTHTSNFTIQAILNHDCIWWEISHNKIKYNGQILPSNVNADLLLHKIHEKHG